MKNENIFLADDRNIRMKFFKMLLHDVLEYVYVSVIWAHKVRF